MNPSSVVIPIPLPLPLPQSNSTSNWWISPLIAILTIAIVAIGIIGVRMSQSLMFLEEEQKKQQTYIYNHDSTLGDMFKDINYNDTAIDINNRRLQARVFAQSAVMSDVSNRVARLELATEKIRLNNQ
jgi:hypothetical protein